MIKMALVLIVESLAFGNVLIYRAQSLTCIEQREPPLIMRLGNVLVNILVLLSTLAVMLVAECTIPPDFLWDYQWQRPLNG